MSFSTATIALAVAVAPATPVTSPTAQAVTYPAELPADCITSGSTRITEGMAVRMPGEDVTSLEGKRACDAYGNMTVISGGVLGPITSYLAPPPVPAPVPAVPATVAPVTQVEAVASEGGDIAGIIIGCTIFGGFLSLFAGGVFLAVRHSYRVNPDPSVKWAGPPLMLAGAGGPPSVRDQLEGMYQGSPGYAESPGVTDGDSDSRLSHSKAETSQSRPHVTGVTANPGKWDEWGDPIEDEIQDVRGMSLADFKTQHDPHGGDFQIENLVYPDMAGVASRRLFNYVRAYGAINVRCAVWSVFGLTHKGGDSPSAKRYQQAAEWTRKQFSDEGFMPF